MTTFSLPQRAPREPCSIDRPPKTHTIGHVPPHPRLTVADLSDRNIAFLFYFLGSPWPSGHFRADEPCGPPRLGAGRQTPLLKFEDGENSPLVPRGRAAKCTGLLPFCRIACLADPRPDPRPLLRQKL